MRAPLDPGAVRPVVLLFEPIHAKALDILRQRADVRMATSLEEPDLLTQVGDVDGIIIRANGKVSRRLMQAAPRLKVVARHGVGVEAIDRQAAAEMGIAVVNTPDANVESVAEQCLGMMIALAKRLRLSDRAIRAGDWDARYRLIGNELLGKTLGLVGFGRIGQRLAAMCHSGLSMGIVYFDVVSYPGVEKQLEARRMPLGELLSRSDFVSVHTPLVRETRGIIDEKALRSMKPGAFLLNTSRGPVVDQAALVRALQEGWIAGAGLDVYDPEPLPADSPLLQMDNVVLSPHMAAHTDEALLRMAMVITDVLAVIEGRRPENPVAWKA
ncbi:MAG TPA: hydroxyacid dehydrogenase [Anaerolineales bacterium]|nr:hydroxyacid dehydrogenase [Anaerolineales bacterium]